MNFHDEELKHCALKAKELEDHYLMIALAADSTERSVDWLTDICAKYCAKKIRLEELEINKDETTVWGACFALAEIDTYDIAIAYGLNYCWKRFVICKELFHAVLETPGHHNLDLEKHVEEVTLAFPVDDSEPSDAVKVEILTEIAAMQFLFPYAARQKELVMLGASSLHYLAIAEKYRVPQIMVERYLSKQHMDVLGKFFGKSATADF